MGVCFECLLEIDGVSRAPGLLGGASRRHDHPARGSRGFMSAQSICWLLAAALPGMMAAATAAMAGLNVQAGG